MLTEEELQALVEDISINQFHRPFLHKATFNSRLRTTGGRYLLSSHNIEINRKYLDELGVEELEGIIKHELCHYHLHLLGRGYKHGDADFKRLLRETGSPRYCSILKSAKPAVHMVKWVYECQSCRMEYKRKRRMDTKKYVCGKCRGKIILKKSLT